MLEGVDELEDLRSLAVLEQQDFLFELDLLLLARVKLRLDSPYLGNEFPHTLYAEWYREIRTGSCNSIQKSTYPPTDGPPRWNLRIRSSRSWFQIASASFH